MKSLKLAIMQEVKDELAIFNELTLNEMCAHFFNTPSTLRLTRAGFKHLKAVFTSYSFEVDRTTLRNKHLMVLSTVMEYPYYFTKDELIVFSDSDAAMIRLSGSLEKFLEVYM